MNFIQKFFSQCRINKLFFLIPCHLVFQLHIPKRIIQILSLVLILFLFAKCGFLKKSPPPVFQWPLKKFQLTQKFSNFKKPPHLGIDLKAPIGSPIFSSHPGKVVYAGKKLTGYGYVIMLEHPLGWASLYAHLQEIKVKINQKVGQGDVIGTVGMTGRTSGPHLHFELMYNKRTVNPLLYLP